jgi:phosphoribosylformylglycinamidine synthase subunit PurQ / glutaminase
MPPNVLILRSAGTNCDAETAYAFELAGGSPESIHINRLLERPALLDSFQILAIPGGFSYGDDIASGKILAAQITRRLGDDLRRFVDAGKPVIGICNGFQVLIKTDLLPDLPDHPGQSCTLTHNVSHRFVDKWITLAAQNSKSIWTRGIEQLELPIAHGEGKFVPRDESVRLALHDAQQIAFTYVGENPNGSIDGIAGVCDQTGLVLGLMPHPERHISPLQHPAWTRSKNALADTGPGLRLFKNAVEHASSVATGV